MPQTYIIRKMKSAEAEALSKIRLKSLHTDPDAFLATMEEERRLSLKDHEAYLIKNYVLGAFTQSGELIGTLVYIEQDRQKFRHIGILGGMYVDPSHRGRGLGRKLVSTMLHNLRKTGHLYGLQLKVVTTNTPAIRLYESAGFSVWATEKNALFHNGNFFDQHHMMLTFPT